MPTIQFKTKPPLSVIFALSALIPITYLLALILTNNQFVQTFQLLLFFLPSVWLIRRYGVKADKSNIWISALISIGITLGLSIVLNELLTHWLTIFPIPAEFEVSFQALFSQNKKYGIYIDIFAIALIPSVAEEFFFRGFLQTGLNNHYKPLVSIIITSVIFALFHVNPWIVPFYLLLGIWFSFIYHKTNSIWFAVLAHFTNNAYGVLMYHYWM